MISASRIRRISAGTATLDDVTFHVAAGECVRVSGSPLGAPSMLLRICATLVRPTSGALSIYGIDAIARPDTARRALAYANPAMLPAVKITVEEYLSTIARARGIRDQRAIRACVERSAAAPDTYLDELAPAYRAAVALSAALIGRPTVLLLDAALMNIPDADRPPLVECVREARANGAAILVASDEEDQLTTLCGRMLRLHAGAIHSGLSPLADQSVEPACAR